MQLVNMDVERHGSHGPISLGPLSPGFNALCGPAGSGKSALLSWLRQLAHEDHPRGASYLDTAWNPTRPALLGSVEVANRGLQFRLSSHNSVPRGYSRSNYSNYSPDALPRDQARNNLTVRQLAAFAAMASTSPTGETAFNEPTGGFERELEIAAQRLGLDVQPASSHQHPEREHLLARQRDIESRLQQLDELHLSREALLARRDELQRELIEADLRQSEARLAELDGELAGLQTELKQLETSRHSVTVDDSYRVQLQQIDERLTRWRQTLRDLKEHRNRIEHEATDARLDRQVGDQLSATKEPDPRAPLRSLEAQILSARNQLDALVDRYSVFQDRRDVDQRHDMRDQRDPNARHGYGDRRGYRDRRGYGDRRSDYAVHQDSFGRTHIAYAGDYYYPDSSNLPDTLRSMQKDLYEACQQLARHESRAATETLRQQSQQLQRELNDVLAQLDQCEDRERLLREAEDLRQRLAAHQPVHHQGSYFRELVHRHIAGLMGGRERISSRAAYRHAPEVVQRRYDLVDGIVYDQERRVETEVPTPLVHVAQRLAIAEAMATRAEPVPVLIDEALDHISQDDQVASIAYLAHVAAAGQQILLMTGSQRVAELVRQQHGWVAYLKSNATPAMDINRQLTAVANDYEASKWFQPNVYSEPLRSATLSSPLYLTERSRIEESPSIDGVLAARLRAVGIDRIGDLLDVDPHWLAEQLRQDGVSDATVASWQAEARLLCSVRQLRPFDARLLVSIGVRTPQQLADMRPSQLLDRVERFVATDRGRRFLRSGSSYELSRITNWIASAKGGAGRFQGSSFVDHGWAGSHDEYDRGALDGYHAEYEDESGSPRRESTSRGSSDRERNSQRQRRPAASSRSARSRSPDYSNLHRAAHSTSAGERNVRPAVAREEPGARQPRARLERKARERRHPEAIKLAETSSLKFYLELASPVVDAPSIGPRMAARLEKLGIYTVDQLLAANATSLTDKLNLRRIDAATIRAWQEQARLVCRIPNLRGHDAQLLVACNLTSPEELATMQAAAVLKQVLAVAQSSEGQRILRGSKQPDLVEVNDWIDWASQCRSLNAA